MKELAFYDGRIIDPKEPVIRVNDRAYQFGDGVYEAWMVDRGRQILRPEHLARFERSAAALGIVPTTTTEQIGGWADALVDQSGVANGMLYFQWSRGWQFPRNHVPTPDLKPVLSGFIKVRQRIEVPRPFSVVFHSDERQSFCHIKTLNLLGSVRAITAAAADGYDDALLVRPVDGQDVVTEGTRSNAFAVKNGTLFTAPLGPYLLPGITRAKILELATDLGIPVVEGYQSPDFFAQADEVFYTSCTALDPVVRIGSVTIGSGKPGPVFEKLYRAYGRFIASA